MGLFRRKREPFLTATPDTSIPGMTTSACVAPAPRLPASSARPVASDAERARFSMPVGDTFTIRNRGTVVAGAVGSGAVRQNDEVEVVRDGRVVTTLVVSGVESHQQQLEQAEPGQEVGLLLQGPDHAEVTRGDTLRATS